MDEWMMDEYDWLMINYWISSIFPYSQTLSSILPLPQPLTLRPAFLIPRNTAVTNKSGPLGLRWQIKTPSPLKWPMSRSLGLPLQFGQKKGLPGNKAGLVERISCHASHVLERNAGEVDWTWLKTQCCCAFWSGRNNLGFDQLLKDEIYKRVLSVIRLDIWIHYAWQCLIDHRSCDYHRLSLSLSRIF